MTKIETDLTDILPNSAIELIGLIGLSETFILIEHYGGTAIWIPNKAVEGHPNGAEIGLGAWSKLCARYGSTYLEIPLCKRAVNQLRERQILNESVTLTDQELARRYNTTERTIRRIRERHGVTPRCDKTLDLFNDIINAA